MPLSPASSSGASATPASRDDTVLTAQGFIAQSAQLEALTGNLTPGSQSLRASALGLLVGDVITNILLLIGTAAGGTAPTLQKVGLLDNTGAVIRASNDLSASAVFTALGIAVCPLSSPVTIGTSGLYYGAYVRNGNYGTTNPTFLANAGPGFNYAALAGKPLPFGLTAAVTDMVGPFTIAATGQGCWFGVN